MHCYVRNLSRPRVPSLVENFFSEKLSGIYKFKKKCVSNEILPGAICASFKARRESFRSFLLTDMRVFRENQRVHVKLRSESKLLVFNVCTLLYGLSIQQDINIMLCTAILFYLRYTSDTHQKVHPDKIKDETKKCLDGFIQASFNTDPGNRSPQRVDEKFNSFRVMCSNVFSDVFKTLSSTLFITGIFRLLNRFFLFFFFFQDLYVNAFSLHRHEKKTVILTVTVSEVRFELSSVGCTSTPLIMKCIFF